MLFTYTVRCVFCGFLALGSLANILVMCGVSLKSQ